MRPRTCVLSALAWLLAPLYAQDPVPPPGGFAVTSSVDNVMTWSDGYKTYLNAVYPNVAAPVTGWPVLLVVHGGGTSRNVGWARQTQLMMAKAGYFAVAYDVRGQGDTGKLNKPNDPGTRARQLADLADSFNQIEVLWPALVDDDRLAVYGQSQGGAHGFKAAAYSQKALPLAGYTTDMPKISAVITDIQAMDTAEDTVPQGVLFSANTVVNAYQERGTADPFVQAYLAGDAAGFLTLWKADPAQYYFPELQTSRVPLYVMNSYDDANHVVNLNVDKMPQLVPGIPRRFFLTTGGHGSQQNDVEENVSYDAIRRWCDKFLKHIANDIDKEPFAEVAMMPSSPARYADPTSFWAHRQSTAWPPAIAPTRRFLRAPGNLLPNPPAAAEPTGVLRHRVQMGYDEAAFLAHAGNPALVLPHVPYVSLDFDDMPAPREMELFGRPVVELDVSAQAPIFQLAATLWDVPPAGPARYITSGVTGRRTVAPGRHRLRIEISDIAYVLERGHYLRLSLENVNLRQQVGHLHFVVAPELDSYDLGVRIDPIFPPFVDLPLRVPECSIGPRLVTVSAAAGIDHRLFVDGERIRGGDFYLMVMTGSGTTPGLVLPPLLPINPDAWTLLGLSLVNTPFFNTFAGLLDADGQAQGRFIVPSPTAGLLAGKRFDFAVLGVSPGNVLFTSAPSTLIIDP